MIEDYAEKTDSKASPETADRLLSIRLFCIVFYHCYYRIIRISMAYLAIGGVAGFIR
jgi:hypothetical protein